MESLPILKEEGGYKLELEDNFGFAQFDLNDPMTRPHAKSPCMSSILGHDRFAYITETQRIAIVSPEFFSFAQEIGNLKSICSAFSGFLLCLAEVEGEGRLYLLNEDGDVLGQKKREESYFPFPLEVKLLSSVSNELVCFQDTEGVYIIDMKHGAMFDLQVPNDAQVRYCHFISEATLLFNWTVDAESEWTEFTLKSRGDELEFEKKTLNWEGYLGHSDFAILAFSSNDSLLHSIPNIESSFLIKHLGYIAASKTDKVGISANDSYAVILTASHLHIYERNFQGDWGRQWLKPLPYKQHILGFTMLREHFFILLPAALVCIHFKCGDVQ